MGMCLDLMKYLPVFVLLFTELLGLLLIVFVDLLLLIAPLQLRFAHSKLRLNNFLQVLKKNVTGLGSVCSGTLSQVVIVG